MITIHFVVNIFMCMVSKTVISKYHMFFSATVQRNLLIARDLKF